MVLFIPGWLLGLLLLLRKSSLDLGQRQALGFCPNETENYSIHCAYDGEGEEQASLRQGLDQDLKELRFHEREGPEGEEGDPGDLAPDVFWADLTRVGPRQRPETNGGEANEGHEGENRQPVLLLRKALRVEEEG